VGPTGAGTALQSMLQVSDIELGQTRLRKNKINKQTNKQETVGFVAAVKRYEKGIDIVHSATPYTICVDVLL
jgi:hypothetical protein